MPASSFGFPPITVNLPGVNAVMSDIPVQLPASPSSLALDDEQLMQTVHYTHEGKLITFEIVNKRMSLTQLDSKTEEVDPIPRNIFERILKATFFSCVLFGMQRVKAKPLSTPGTI